ncbi:MAG: hypothetical protein C0404_13510 [Verrucomicrobia bacterium]|nr:hypothetical protein [Verrucomicrobiota bacterium]
MNDRITELVLKYADGTISEAEFAELQGILDSDEEATRACLRLLDIETVLRSNPEGLDLTEATLRRIREDVRSRIVDRSMSRIAAGKVSRPRRHVPWAAILTLAAGLVIAAGVWLGMERSATRPPPAVRGTAGSARIVAKVEQVSGVRCQVSGGNRLEVAAGGEIRVGDQIETGKDGKVKFRYLDENTVIEVGDSSVLVCVATTNNVKKLNVEKGRLAANVAKQPEGKRFVVVTPHAVAEVVGTAFDILVSSKSSELDVIDGKLQYTRLSDGKKLLVQEGQSTVAGEGREFILGKCKYYPGGEYVDGEVLFKDDLMTGIDNWEVLVSTNGKPLRLATEQETARIVRKVNPDDKLPYPREARGMLVTAFQGETVALRLKKPIPVVPMSVQFVRQAQTGTSLGILYGDVLEEEVIREFPHGQWEPSGPHKTRRELMPLEIKGNAQIVLERSFVWDKPWSDTRLALARRDGIYITLTFTSGYEGKNAVFSDVVVRAMKKTEVSK